MNKKALKYNSLWPNCNCIKKNRALKQNGTLFDGDSIIMKPKKQKKLKKFLNKNKNTVKKFIKSKIDKRQQGKLQENRINKEENRAKKIQNIRQALRNSPEGQKDKLKPMAKKANNRLKAKLNIKKLLQNNDRQGLRSLLLDGRRMRIVEEYLMKTHKNRKNRKNK